MEKIKLSYWIPWFLSLAVTFVIMYIMTHDEYFRLPYIVCMEFSESKEAYFSFAGTYKPDQIFRNLYIDFAFIAAYSLLFAFSLKLLNQLSEIIGKNRFLFIAMIPGLLDVIENTFIFYMTKNAAIGDTGYCIYRIIVAAKWTFVIVFVTLTFVIVIHQLLNRLSIIINFIERKRSGES